MMTRLKQLLAQDDYCLVSIASVKEALKAEPNKCENDKNVALDKIRAEIEDHCGLAKENHCKYCSYCNSVMGVREILEIIDKCKAENEVKE